LFREINKYPRRKRKLGIEVLRKKRGGWRRKGV